VTVARARRRGARWGILLLASSALMGASACPAFGAESTPAPAWSIRAISRPTFISPTTGGYISVVVTNDGGAATNGAMTVTDTVPTQLQAVTATEHALPGGVQANCPIAAGIVTCTYAGDLGGENTQALSITIAVQPSGVPGTAENEASVSGGSAATEIAKSPALISAAAAPFGLSDFHFSVLNAAGSEDTQAGDHPNVVTVGVDFNTVPKPLRSEAFAASEPPKSLSLELPLGMIGDPQGLPTCQQYELTNPPSCPSDTVIGTVVYRAEAAGVMVSEPKSTGVTPLFNMQPESGYPAEFAFESAGHVADIYTSVIHRATGGYAMRLYAPAITPLAALTGMQLTFFGDPSTVDGSGNPPTSLFTTPFDCAPEDGLPTATVSTSSWTAPSGTAPSEESVTLSAPSGCSSLRFTPQISIEPATTEADAPTGVAVHLAVAQEESAATGPATPPLKDATITLPAGMSLSLPAGNSLSACPAAGPEAIDLYEEQPGVDGFPHPVAGHCPASSRLGVAKITTPLLAAPLEGSVYLAQPGCAPCDERQVEEGDLLGVYVEAEGSGINLELPGVIEVGGAGHHARKGDPGGPLAPGQLRLQLLANPQLPTSEVQLDLNGGQQALLANPARCGQATSTSEVVPWGAEAIDATPESSFDVGSSETGGACPQTSPFAPSFSAGTATAQAGTSSPFTMTFARHDREQPLSSISMQTPPGFAAEMAGVPQCSEPQAALGQCPATSEVGQVHVALGPGSQPLWVEGPVYLTGPYHGAPFGLSLVIPAKAGPFDLGDVIVRAAIAVDPHTAALTVSAGPLPTNAAAVPLRIQTVSMTLDRPGFTIEPTDCSQQAVTASIDSSEGASAAASTPFAVGACASLPFKALLTAHSEAKTSRNDGAMLHLKLYSGAGQANAAKLRVVLPKQLPTRLSALQQACPARLFDANPASCPVDSVIGQAIVHTKMLSSPLVGPAYFVSHGGVRFPDIELVLQGEGVLVDLDGFTTIENGITTAAFDSLPDMQLQSLGLMLPEGPHSLLGADGSLCAKPLLLSMSLVGQNGAKEATTTTHLAVGRCPRR
jgi:hypothetical protein